MADPPTISLPVADSLWQRLVRSDSPWRLARTAGFLCLAWMISLMWGRWGIPGVDAPDPLMYTNLGNLLFWVVFLMGLPLLALFAGRAFCAACPMGALNESVSRLGLGRSFPRPLRNDAGKAALLLLTLALVGIGRIHHWPGATAWYLAGWVALAVLLGVFFRGRSLCSFACPIGGMLGLYSRASFPEVGVADPSVCRSCEGKECVRGRDSWTTAALGRLNTAFRFRRPGCPVNLKPWEIEGSGRCLLCGNCLRACPYGNAVLRARRPLAALWRESFPRFTETITAAALLGFLLLSFARFWPALAAVLAFPGAAITPLFGVSLSRVVFILWGGFLLPLLVLTVPALYARWRIVSEGAGEEAPARGERWGFRIWMGEKNPAPEETPGEEEGAVKRTDTVRGLMAFFLPAYIPLLISGHLLLAGIKLNAKASYLALGFFDPSGVRSYMMVEESALLPRPGMLVPLVPLKWGLLGLFLLSAVLSAGVAISIARREKLPAGPTVAALLAVAVAVGGGFLQWLF
ncbi:MAG: 4Fe-4S binding protein [bacterium]